MNISTAQYPKHGQDLGTAITVALGPATRSSVARLQERTGLSQAELANCALTWYAYLDAQLRAGYSLTLRNEITGKASTLSLSAGRGASAQGSHWLHSLAVTPVRPWLANVTSRGSPPAAAPRGGGTRPTYRDDSRSPVRASTRAARNGGSS